MKSLITKFQKSVGSHGYYYEKRLEISQAIESKKHDYANTTTFWSLKLHHQTFRLEFDL